MINKALAVPLKKIDLFLLSFIFSPFLSSYFVIIRVVLSAIGGEPLGEDLIFIHITWQVNAKKF
jgi:hypothetical protein